MSSRPQRSSSNHFYIWWSRLALLVSDQSSWTFVCHIYLQRCKYKRELKIKNHLLGIRKSIMKEKKCVSFLCVCVWVNYSYPTSHREDQILECNARACRCWWCCKACMSFYYEFYRNNGESKLRERRKKQEWQNL